MNPPPTTDKYLYVCHECGLQLDAVEVHYLCPDCSVRNQKGQPQQGVLKVLYDYSRIRGILPGGVSGFKMLKVRGYLDLLPIDSLGSLPPLSIGKTPLYDFRRFDGKNMPFRLWLKDDGVNPTFSFKDRASALVSAFARERGLDTIAAASTGNAGSSIAGICASQGQKAVVLVPETAPLAKLTQIVIYGAQIIKVKGSYDDAFDLSIKTSNEHGWYNRNTAYNPLTIEGKKTVSFELFDQLKYKLPDRIFVSVGDGVILSGVYKGFEDLLQLGIIDRMPVLVAVQAEASDNLVRNLDASDFVARKSATLADSIAVDVPRNFFMARQYLHTCEGESITVSDNEIMSACAMLARNTGLFTEPASAAAFAGLLKYYEQGRIEEGSDNVVLLTGSGLKDVDAVKKYKNHSFEK
jgi:threonine synthase